MIDDRFALTTIAPPRSPLRESLSRLDQAARARLVTTGDDVENAIAAAAAHLEARTRAGLRRALHSRAWVALGLAVGLGILLGGRQRR
jgi:hypothetical protein